MPRSTSSSRDPHLRPRASDPGAGPRRPLKAVRAARAHDPLTPLPPGRAQGQAPAATNRAATIAAELLLADESRAAARAAVRLLYEGTGVPVAAWRVARDEPAELIAVRGLGAPRRRRLRSVGLAPSADDDGARATARLEQRFRTVAGSLSASWRVADQVVLMVADEGDETRRMLGDISRLLERAIDRIAEVRRAKERNRSLERGIALTAHEIRSPLVGVRAALDSLVHIDGPPATRRDLLRRSRDEVEELVDAAESILRFAVDGDRLHRRKVDLSRVAEEAARSTGLGAPSPRIRLRLTSGVMVKADALQLKLALANVLRNALAYSPPETEVTLTVSVRRGVPTAEVLDRGPGVRAADREAIFDPFVRGGTHIRGGRGLGLFIAKRIVEAHGGRIAMSCSRSGTIFRIQLPTGAYGGTV